MKTLAKVKKAMSGVPLPDGERRRYQKCKHCGNIEVREFIPYGLGMGRTFNACQCSLTGRPPFEILEDVEGPIYSIPEEGES